MGLASLSTTLLLLLSLVPLCTSSNQLAPAKPLIFPGRIISNNGVFAMGFFSPTNTSSRFYIGIWYNKVPERTVVWVANRDDPITTTPSPSTTLAVTNLSGLVLSDPTSGRVYWSTTNIAAAGAASAVLLNQGNLVLRSPNGTVLWQSFDHPTDTILPGMPFRVNYRTRLAGRLVSWKGPEDPAAGDFSLTGDFSSGLQYFIWRGSNLTWRSAPWNGGTTSSYRPSDSSSLVILTTITADGDEITLTYTLSDGSSGLRARMTYTGEYEFSLLNRDASAWAWTLLNAYPGPGCSRYASCGSDGYCDGMEMEAVRRTCRCPEGFEPKAEGSGGASAGCTRKEPLRCDAAGDRFVTLTGVKTPATPVFVRNRTLGGCEAECRGNCSCTAYAYANLTAALSGGDSSRCLLWFGQLVDLGKFVDVIGENLYLRLAGSSSPPVQKKRNLLKIVLPVIACVLLLTFTALAWTCKYIGTQQKKKVQKRMMLEYLRSADETGYKNKEFPLISYENIVAATDNFSNSNMIGKGGFGNVYKGTLEGDNEVAVKRLSKGSGQGIDEFRNEVVLIAKLQHKNLVKLHGCCIHEDERLLVYEYLPNKSLDYFLFDSERKPMLQWAARRKIIQGVARGLLYLHQDSRLMIIHRDLKASNILLDKEMNPKISDFGMARIFCGDQLQGNTNRVVGTYGYMSPEYAMEGTFSVKSDTYSFGVLLLEIASGLKISLPHITMDFPNLIAYAWNLKKDGKIQDFVDPAIMENCPLHEVSHCIHIGLLCVQDSPNCRPLMSTVMFMLENETTPRPEPEQPMYFPRRCTKPGKTSDNTESSMNDMSLTVLAEGR